MKLRELGDAYERLKLDTALESAASCAPDLIAKVQELRLTVVTVRDRAVLGEGLYGLGRNSLADSNFEQALLAFRLAHKLAPDRLLFSDRAKLLESSIAERKQVPWRGSLIELQRKLGVVCTKKVCACTSHVQIARCKNLIQPFRDERDGFTIYTLSPYYSRWTGDRWTRLLKAVKKQFQADLLEPIADIAADFLIENTEVLRDADIVVPTPLSIEKFGERGFAPNDIVGKRIGRRLALPFVASLRRARGPATREATSEELEADSTLTAGSLVRAILAIARTGNGNYMCASSSLNQTDAFAQPADFKAPAAHLGGAQCEGVRVALSAGARGRPRDKGSEPSTPFGRRLHRGQYAPRRRTMHQGREFWLRDNSGYHWTDDCESRRSRQSIPGCIKGLKHLYADEGIVSAGSR